MNLSILETAHSIFRPWRAETRSDGLFSTINYVLNRFAKPFLQLLSHTANILFSPNFQGDIGLVAQTQVILIDLFFDLTCQDLPPDFEDSHVQFFGPQGLFLTFLSWNPSSLATEVRVIKLTSKANDSRCTVFSQMTPRHLCHPKSKLGYSKSQR